ncbi:MAG: ribosome recycling factor [Clostridia bacterium]|nr:ribosome recycling factor [Clostridia bacterium]MDD4686284.1 ribosome recycling factor [Clostridia bacterium]
MSETLNEFKKELEKTIIFIKNEYQGIRAGRANPHILDKVLVECYGVLTPLNQMANINVTEARILTINLWDISQMKNVIKSISMADLGVNISDDGRVIRLNFPILTEERRKEIAKSVKSILENTKITMRNQRRDCIDYFKKLKKDGDISEDDLTYYEKEVQKTFDNYVAEVDKIHSAKEREILEI